MPNELAADSGQYHRALAGLVPARYLAIAPLWLPKGLRTQGAKSRTTQLGLAAQRGRAAGSRRVRRADFFFM